jgi:hypothetical protein
MLTANNVILYLERKKRSWEIRTITSVLNMNLSISGVDIKQARQQNNAKVFVIG